MSKLLIVDCETGGLDCTQHSLLSIGLVILDNGNITATKEILINDGVLNCTPEALAINGIDLEEHIKVALKPYCALDELFDFLLEHIGCDDDEKAIVIGHNAKFDTDFIKQFFANNKMNYSTWFNSYPICTIELMKRLWRAGKVYKWPNHKLDTALSYFGLSRPTPHNALADAIATAKLYIELNKLL